MSVQLIESSPVEPLVVGVHLYPGDTWFREVHVRSLTTQQPVDLSAWVFEARLGEHVGVVDASRAAEGRLAMTFTPEQTADVVWGDEVTLSGTLAGGRRTFLHGSVGATVGSSIPVGPAQKTRVVSSDVDISVYAAPRGDKGADGSAVSVALVERAEGAEGRAVTAAGLAAGSATAAAGSASAAAGSAASAGAAAGAAATSATTALGAAEGIVAARDAAAVSAGKANTDADRAGTSAYNAGQSAAAAQGSESAAVTARAGAESARGGAEAARDLALAGQFAGASLGTADLDTVVTPGVYRQNNQGNSTQARNYPAQAAGTLGILTVIQASTDAWMQQEYDPSGYAGQGRVFYRRVRTGGTWQTWRAFASPRVDKTAGIAIYTWDDVASREQLTYGDTGYRSVEGLAANGWSISICTIRRVGSVVTCGIFGGNSNSATSDTVLTIPGGFRPSSLYGGNTQHIVQSGSGQMVPIQFNTSGAMIAPRDKGGIGPGAIALMSWMTTDTWPTTLPGTASGSIPNG